ncbi:MAG: hypothetical protein D6793_07080 [Thermoflexia bacterium]|nr:MAG: hypothetical protein D6793_07080 [Thermoflexia bacterium]
MRRRPFLLFTLFLLTWLLGGCASGINPTAWTTLFVRNGTVYLADLEQVRALDATTGEQLWAFPAQPNLRQYGPFYTVTLLNDELLMVTSSEQRGGLVSHTYGVLRALRLEDGREAWAQPFVAGEFVAPGAAGDGIFVIGSSDRNIYALRVEDGSLVWTYPTRGRVWATPRILSDTVYIASLDHTLYALDLRTGALRWQFQAQGAMADSPLILGDVLYLGAFDRNLYALRLSDGQELWRFTGSNWFWGTPATDGSRLYAADVNGVVYALDPATGQEIWRSQVEGTVRLGPAVGGDGQRVLVATENGILFGLDAADGFVLWRQSGEGVIADMAVHGDRVFITWLHAAHRAQSFYVENGRPIWQYPPAAQK